MLLYNFENAHSFNIYSLSDYYISRIISGAGRDSSEQLVQCPIYKYFHKHSFI